jgi:hypothetical protein
MKGRECSRCEVRCLRIGYAERELDRGSKTCDAKRTVGDDAHDRLRAQKLGLPDTSAAPAAALTAAATRPAKSDRRSASSAGSAECRPYCFPTS